LTRKCSELHPAFMISAQQLHTGRISLGLNVAQLAKLAGVAPNSIWAIERGADFKASTMQALESTLRDAGLLFAPGRVGVKMHWIQGRPESAEIRSGVLGIINAERKSRGQASYVDMEGA
jgi:DNA-binding XRE family transcriptional regulator